MLATLAGGVAAAAPPPEAERAQKPVVDPKARALVEKMSDFLAGQQRFSVQTDGSMEVVLKTGEKIEYDFSSTVRLQRPDKLRSDRRGEVADVEFYYDGRTFTLFGKKTRYYATTEAPPKLDDAIDAAREKLGLEAPGADLLYSNPAKILMEDVVSGSNLGSSFVRGVPCQHLAFRGNETDWQLWIEDGPVPVPRKLLIVSKKVEGLPEFVVELSEWDFSPRFNDSVFRFTRPDGAERIDFLEAVPRPGPQGDTK
ncbi:DUF2092 domain-containing protein [Pyxidicoccus trucidator]|uniref:DUF2092 domain-containing protein n=1 Tax=Pyxidicoccus trucidator TaxID=2709662 RepID=UPI0013DCD69A|nr:DUF2092 domain-containing protein [Pyxidicoccus trucidator]